MAPPSFAPRADVVEGATACMWAARPSGGLPEPTLRPRPEAGGAPALARAGVPDILPQRERKKRRGAEATEAVRATAGGLGMTGALGDEPAPDGAFAGNAVAHQLERALLRDAAEAWDTPRLATALTWLELFLAATQRTMFKAARGVSDAAFHGRAWNRRSLDLFTRFIVESPPLGRARGAHVCWSVAASYASAVQLLRTREAGYDVAPLEESFVAPLAAKTVKRTEAPAGERALSVGLRAVHFLLAASAGFDRTSNMGVRRWAAALLAHNLLLRGGEIGVADNAHPEPHRILRGRSVTWRAAVRASKGRPWALVWVIPIKDPNCTHKGYPCPVARRHDGAFGADPLCPYDALALHLWQQCARGPFPLDQRGWPAEGWWELISRSPHLQGPLFVAPNGGEWNTATSRALYRDIAIAAGLDPTKVGGKAARIGGATDARELAGDGGRDVVKRRGRWATDVAEVYQRELLGTQLALSAALGDALGEDLEQLGLGWVQPGG